MSESRPRYDIRDLPMIKCHIGVAWNGYELECAFVPDKNSKSGGIFIERTRSGELRDLPPKRNAHEWGQYPDYWWPIDPDNWPRELPQPLPERSARRRYSATNGFNTVIEVTAEQLAREIEEGREIARAQANKPSKEPREGMQWWRDPHRVTYSKTGNISIEEVEARVSRAILYDGVHPNMRPAEFGADSVLAATAATTVSSEHEDPSSWHVRFTPSQKDHDDYLIAMAWFAALNPPELRPRRRAGEQVMLNISQKVIVWRALNPPLSWRQLGSELHEETGKSSDHYARQRFGQALQQLCAAANGRRVHQHVSVKDQLSAVRESNRAHKAKDPVLD